MARKVLVVDDEPTLVAALRYTLEREGFQVLEAADGETALQLARSQSPDVVILDVLLPGLDGFEVCRRLRRESSVPIIMLTAKGDETDRVVGLELGADDYVAKPFSMRELLARVRALLRRAQGLQHQGDTIVSGDLRLDLRRREAYRGDAPLPLKPKEFDLLAFFMRHRGRAFSREELLDQVWGYEYAGDTRTVDVHVRWLREKIEETPGKPTRIITVRGLGYRFEG
ncbi:MAG TPA: response regulator transcription factor [Dehalococcoidia bacterium]|nr:response regulator transcription factor [Dehalococcoidia bacterium]